MLVKNVSDIWHIDYRAKEGKKRYKIFTHNEPVELPECAESDPFIKWHIKKGNLVVVESVENSDLEDLREQCDELEIEYRKNAGEKKLKELLAAHKENQ